MRDWTTFTKSLVALPEEWRMILLSLINCNSNTCTTPELTMGHSIPLLIFSLLKSLTDLSDMTVLQCGWKISLGLASQSIMVQGAEAVSKNATWTCLADVSNSTHSTGLHWISKGCKGRAESFVFTEGVWWEFYQRILSYGTLTWWT